MSDSIATPPDTPRILPTEAGSVIGWSVYYDGNHYCTAVLTWADWEEETGDELRWFVSGFPESRSTEELQSQVGAFWQDLGQLEPSVGNA